MNKIKYLLISFVLLIFFTLSTNSIIAQVNYQLGVVHYKSHEDLLFLFGNTSRTLVYLAGEKVEKPTFVGLFTKGQKEAIEKQKLEIRIIDESTDSSEYVVLYHPLPDQGEKLSNLGVPTQFTKRFTLLKLANGKEFSHEGVGGEFFEVPIMEGITPPPNATPVLPLTEQVQKNPSQSVEPEKNGNTRVLVVVLISTVLLGVGIGVLLILKKRRSSSSF